VRSEERIRTKKPFFIYLVVGSRYSAKKKFAETEKKKKIKIGYAVEIHNLVIRGCLHRIPLPGLPPSRLESRGLD